MFSVYKLSDVFRFFITNYARKNEKNLLTLVFAIVFLCGASAVVSAKNTPSSANSVPMSKKLLIANNFFNKTKVNKGKCNFAACDSERNALIAINTIYEFYCAPQYLLSCEPVLQTKLREAAKAYDDCLRRVGEEEQQSKNIDGKKDRNKFRKNLNRNV